MTTSAPQSGGGAGWDQPDDAEPSDEASHHPTTRTVLRRSFRAPLAAPGDTAAPRDTAAPPDTSISPGPDTPAQEAGPARPDATPPPGPPTVGDLEDSLRARLGLRALGARLHPTAALWGWLGPLVVTVLAGVMRLTGLNHPSRLIFDETYYVKQAYSLLTLGYEGQWAEESNPGFARGDYSGLSTTADYVVHPSVGKWMIAAGLKLFGADNGAGWRFAAAVVGTLSVLILARLATRLFGSALLGTTAGLLLAIDGIHLTESRTSLLDVFLMFWVLVGLWCVVRDRDWSRAQLAHRVARARARADGHGDGDGDGHGDGLWGPPLGVRWWLVVAGVALGLATGVKWSGLYAVAVFGVMVFVWDTCARRSVGVRRWAAAGVLRGGMPAFLALVPTAALIYVATWIPWFTTPQAYRRQWAANLRASGEPVPRGWLPDAVNSWWEYHLVMWDFHNGLDSEHAYEANPAGWLLQLRPTSMFWPDPAPPPEACGAQRCVQAILAVGNPVIWWLAAAALLAVVYVAVRGRDWRAWLILAGYGAMYVPWLGYAHRTIFTFYAVAFVPYVVLALTFVLGWGMGLVRPPGSVRPPGRGRPPDSGRPEAGRPDGAIPGAGTTEDDTGPVVHPSRAALFVSDDGDARLNPAAWVLWGVVVGLAVAVAVFFWPVWTGQTISYEGWRLHMWLPTWI
ncbi:phospholipid carrier-dependent glycosyltransferase [Georgenia yuyongxinii]|uniref:Polyprenol-phosphate-mannose--protein mannosyltransferase n=1 Tax=Georgenia yuyongxinii TaxID=2589797 RepID=A0A5B8C1C2_9MICO|nr:phospholipid carrier-dependent glycosyltransferase [Georgenia yuyongxinii]QDC23887.1 phospholipid carrier-dependent glycosyltransferase [Georgenia yuyongxinii]